MKITIFNASDLRHPKRPYYLVGTLERRDSSDSTLPYDQIIIATALFPSTRDSVRDRQTGDFPHVSEIDLLAGLFNVVYFTGDTVDPNEPSVKSPLMTRHEFRGLDLVKADREYTLELNCLIHERNPKSGPFNIGMNLEAGYYPKDSETKRPLALFRKGEAVGIRR